MYNTCQKNNEVKTKMLGGMAWNHYFILSHSIQLAYTSKTKLNCIKFCKMVLKYLPFQITHARMCQLLLTKKWLTQTKPFDNSLSYLISPKQHTVHTFLGTH